jgi:hypothetical protein
VQRRWPIANISTSRACRELCLAVRSLPAPYSVRLPETVTAPPGKEVQIKASLRRASSFSGKVQMVGLNLPSGFGLATVEIPADKSEVTAKVTVANNVAPGEYTLVLRGDAQVPYQREAKEAKRNIRVADPSTPVTVVVEKK